MIGTFCLFIMLGIGGMLQSKMVTSPVSSMKGITASVSSEFFVDMLALEVPQMESESTVSTFSEKKVFEFLFHHLTDIKPGDPKTMIASELPGMGREVAVLLHSGSSHNRLTSPAEYTPPQEVLLPVPPREDAELDAILDETESNDSVQESMPNEQLTTGDQKKVFIYHSHNRESWIPELAHKGVTEGSAAFDAEINITLLGERFSEQLMNNGIGAFYADTDYPTEVEGYQWAMSYRYSLDTVQEAFAQHPELEYFLDLHRDSQKRDITTVEIDGEDYAQVFFIIGHNNPNWKENEAFALQIHQMLEASHPGISRGIWSKTSNSGHAEYNQSVSPNSILIEIGGVENTLEESYRTIDVLAATITEIFWDAHKVDAGPEQFTDAKLSTPENINKGEG